MLLFTYDGSYMAFIDECKIVFKAGDGGNGLVAWRREAHVPLGGPAGGNGGNGGNIIIRGNHNENSLQNLKFIKHVTAKNGENGQIKTMHGKSADDVIVQVPVGTIIYDLNTNEEIVDISEDGQEFVICHGGQGGYGNFHFKSGFNKNPSLFELGDKGEKRECKLILKHIADIGIVGLPNAGKSSFISLISAAKPKTANYQFTTLIPVLGTIYINNRKIIFADIPGLIEGASQGLGLGHDFLKHIERTSVLIHMVSMDEQDSSDPYESYTIIMNELEKYSSQLIKKPMIVVANKMDVEGAQQKFEQFKKKIAPIEVIKLSTVTGQNVDVIVEKAHQLLLEENKKQQVNRKLEVIKYVDPVPMSEKLDRTVIVTNPIEGIWEIECEFIKYWAHKIPLTTQDNIIRFNQKMKTVMIEDILREKGAKPGDTIRMYGVEMQYDG